MPAIFPVEVVVTPRFDLFYALHALTSEASSPLSTWKERVEQALPGDFGGAAKRVAPVPLFWPLLADALQSTPGAMTLDEMFSALRSLPESELRASILSGIFQDARTVELLISKKKTVAEVVADATHPAAALFAHFGLRPFVGGSGAPELLSTLLSRPAAYRSELVNVLEKFRLQFQTDWAALQPALREERDRLRARSKQHSMGELATELNLPAVFEERSGVMRTKSGAEVQLRQIERCFVIPSAFNTRRWWAKYERRGRLTVYFSVWIGSDAANALTPGRASDPRPRSQEPSRAAAINVEAVFRALGDTTRYAIASILARDPVSSAELSRRLQVSKPTITHHVQALRAAGLIIDITEGGSSRLSLNRETLAALSTAALEDLYSSGRALSLATTRQRHPETKT